MKIAVVSTMILPTPAIKGGAVETLTTYLIEENEIKNQYDIDLYTVYDKKLSEYNYKYTNIIPVKINLVERLIQKVINLKNRLTKQKPYLRVLYKTAKLIEKKDYDKIVVENNMFAYQIIQKRVKKPLIYHMHNDFNSYDKTEENYKQVANTAERVLTVSNYIKERCEAVRNNQNVKILYNCIDEKLYYKRNDVSIRKQYGIEDGDIVIGYIGRITQEKGILELVKAVKSVITQKNIKLLIVGSQWYSNLKMDNYMKKIVQEVKSIEEKVIFSGYIQQEKIPSFYDAMDIVVVPSLCEEAFGCVAVEAMAMEKPVIVAESGGLPEIVKDNFGFIIKKDEKFINNLAERIQLLVNNENLRREYGRNAKLEFEKNKKYHKEQYFINFANLISK